jgi:hypothetical protein
LKLKRILLVVFAAIPFILILRDFLFFPPNRLLPGDGLVFCVLWGFAWCLLFAHTYVHAERGERRRLLLISPLVLFAFGFPVPYALLCIVIMVQIARGVAPP